jgi:hypothetical protein
MTVALVTTTLRFKAHVRVQTNPRAPEELLVGDVSIPKDVFCSPEQHSELTLKYPWRLDYGERSIDGLRGLQRRISSSVEGQDKYYFIPSDYLIGVVEK